MYNYSCTYINIKYNYYYICMYSYFIYLFLKNLIKLNIEKDKQHTNDKKHGMVAIIKNK